MSKSTTQGEPMIVGAACGLSASGSVPFAPRADGGGADLTLSALRRAPLAFWRRARLVCKRQRAVCAARRLRRRQLRAFRFATRRRRRRVWATRDFSPRAGNGIFHFFLEARRDDSSCAPVRRCCGRHARRYSRSGRARAHTAPGDTGQTLMPAATAFAWWVRGQYIPDSPTPARYTDSFTDGGAWARLPRGPGARLTSCHAAQMPPGAQQRATAGLPPAPAPAPPAPAGSFWAPRARAPAAMDATPPPGGGVSGSGGAPPGKGQQQQQQARPRGAGGTRVRTGPRRVASSVRRPRQSTPATQAAGAAHGAPAHPPPPLRARFNPNLSRGPQPLIELFGSDVYTAGITLVLLLLGAPGAGAARVPRAARAPGAAGGRQTACAGRPGVRAPPRAGAARGSPQACCTRRWCRAARAEPLPVAWSNPGRLGASPRVWSIITLSGSSVISRCCRRAPRLGRRKRPVCADCTHAARGNPPSSPCTAHAP